MRCELNLIVREVQLLKQFAGMAVTKHSICRQIVRCMHKEVCGNQCLTRATDPGLRIADDSMVQIDQIGRAREAPTQE